MGFIRIYLVGYFILLVGAGFALWQSGILEPDSGGVACHCRSDRSRVRDRARGRIDAAHDHDDTRVMRLRRAGLNMPLLLLANLLSALKSARSIRTSVPRSQSPTITRVGTLYG